MCIRKHITLILLLFPLFAFSQPTGLYQYEAKYQSNYDGDTYHLRFKMPKKTKRRYSKANFRWVRKKVRGFSHDSYELDDEENVEKAKLAKNIVEYALTKADKIIARFDHIDNNSRWVCEVWVQIKGEWITLKELLQEYDLLTGKYEGF